MKTGCSRGGKASWQSGTGQNAVDITPAPPWSLDFLKDYKADTTLVVGTWARFPRRRPRCSVARRSVPAVSRDECARWGPGGPMAHLLGGSVARLHCLVTFRRGAGMPGVGPVGDGEPEWKRWGCFPRTSPSTNTLFPRTPTRRTRGPRPRSNKRRQRSRCRNGQPSVRAPRNSAGCCVAGPGNMFRIAQCQMMVSMSLLRDSVWLGANVGEILHDNWQAGLCLNLFR